MRDGEPAWRTAAEVQVGQSLLRKDGSWTTVQTIEKVEQQVWTYNIEVEGDHTFFVHGYLVHNKEECPQF